MNDERWRIVERLFEEAHELSPDARTSFLEEACGGDEELYVDVAELLAMADPHPAESGASRGRPDPVREDMSGTKLGRYQLVRRIGRGAMGVVYEARQVGPDRTVALKVLRSQQDLVGDGDPRAYEGVKARFQEEAEILGRLNHPGVIPVHELGEDRGRVFFTMRLVVGEDLDRIIRWSHEGRDGWNLHRGLEVVLRMCETMVAAHGAGVLHRDLKPSHVKVGRYGEVYILDWGLAKILGRPDHKDIRIREMGGPDWAGGEVQTVDGDYIGTPGFMPPEQARGRVESVGEPSDVYAVGAILYHLLTGYVPYLDKGGGARGALERVRNEAPTPVLELKPDLPAELVAICERAMAREIEDRYPSMEELRADLHAFLANRVVRAYRTGPAAELGKWYERNRSYARVSLALLSVAMLTVAGFAVSATMSRNNLVLAKGDLEEAAGELRKSNTELEELTANLERHAYRADLSAAELSFEGGDFLRAINFLNDCPPTERGWEWGHQNLRFKRYLYLLSAGGPVSAIAFLPEGSWFVSASADMQLKVWDFETGDIVQRLARHTTPVTAVAVRGDGLRLVSGSEDGNLRLWDAETWEELFSWNPHVEEVTALAYDHVQGRIVSGSRDKTIRVFDGKGEQLILIRTNAAVQALAMTPDGSRIVSGGGVPRKRILRGARTNLDPVVDSVLSEWNADTGELLRELGGVQGLILSADVAPDGKRVVAGTEDGRIHLWNLETEEHREIAAAGVISSVTFTVDGERFVAAASDKALHVYDGWTGEHLDELTGHHENVSSVEAGDEFFVSGDEAGAIAVWDARTAPVFNLVPETGGALSGLAFSPDGLRVAASSWDQSVRVIDASDGTVLRTLVGHDSRVLAVDFSPDGSRILSGASDGRAILWDAATWAITSAFSAHAGRVRAVAFAPDGALVATGGDDKLVRLWDARTAEEVGSSDEQVAAVTALAVAPGKRVVFGCDDGAVRIWDPYGTRRTLPIGRHSERVSSLAVSEDGRLVATASKDQTVRVWDLERGEEVHVLADHGDSVTAVAFTSDAQRIASATLHGKVWIWDAVSGNVLMTTISPMQRTLVHCLAFSPDDTRLACGTMNGEVGFWESEIETAREMWAGIDGRRRADEKVAELIDDLVVPAAVIEFLRGDPSLTPEDRDRAIRTAENWSVGWGDVFARAWEIALDPGRRPAEYDRALLWSREVVRSVPGPEVYHLLLGVACYRARRDVESRTSIARALDGSPDRPPMLASNRAAGLAVLALLELRGGDADAAGELLAQAKATLPENPDGPCERLVLEAEQALAR